MSILSFEKVKHAQISESIMNEDYHQFNFEIKTSHFGILIIDQSYRKFSE